MDAFLEIKNNELVCGIIDGRLKSFRKFSLNNHLYDIYIARVEKYIPAIDAFFLSLDDKTKGFLTNPANKKLKSGDEILCQVIRINEPPKNDRVIDNIFLSYENYLYYPLKNRYKENDRWVSKNRIPERVQSIFIEEYKNLIKESKFLPIPRRLTQSRRPVIEFFTEQYKNIVTNSKSIHKTFSPLLTGNWTIDPNYHHEYDERISKDLLSLKQRIIPLKSGGEIVIDKTESLIAIDINTKSARSKEERVKTAFEAVEESIYQMEGRNEQGIILLDMFQLESEDQKDLEDFIIKQIQGTNLTYFGTSNLNLLEFTRSTKK